MTRWIRGCAAALAVALFGCDDGAATAADGGGGGDGGAGSGGIGGSAPVLPSDEEILAASWTALPNAPTINGKQDDVYFVDPELGFSVNGTGKIYRTRDGGHSWELLLDQPGTYFRAIVFLDAQRGFAGNIGPGYFPGVTDPQPLYETRDGGDSWTPVSAISGSMPAGICNFTRAGDHLIGVGRVGGPSHLLSSADRGESWTSIDVTAHMAMLIDARFTSPTEGIIIGGSAVSPSLSQTLILHTSDGGQTFSERFRSQTSGELGWKLSFPSDSVGYASVLGTGSSSSFVKTTDGGQSWQALPFVAGGYQAKGVGFITENIGWMGGAAPGTPAYRTRDGGQSWEPDPQLGPLINRFRFVDGWTGYAIGTTIYKLDIAPLL